MDIRFTSDRNAACHSPTVGSSRRRLDISESPYALTETISVNAGRVRWLPERGRRSQFTHYEQIWLAYISLRFVREHVMQLETIRVVTRRKTRPRVTVW